MEIDIANIISAAGTLLAAYFAYNQYTKNKLTDLNVEYFKKEEEKRSYHRSENSAKVFGELWRVLYETKADRVYICLLYTSPSPRDRTRSRMPSSA